MWHLNHTWKITPLANKEPIWTHLPQHGPAWAPKPPKTIQNRTKPDKTNPFQSFPSIPPPAPFTSLLPKQQSRIFSWGMWPLNHTWKITTLANKEPTSPNMGQHGPQNPTSSCILLSAFFPMFSIFLLMDFLKLFQTNIGYRIPILFLAPWGTPL